MPKSSVISSIMCLKGQHFCVANGKFCNDKCRKTKKIFAPYKKLTFWYILSFSFFPNIFHVYSCSYATILSLELHTLHFYSFQSWQPGDLQRTYLRKRSNYLLVLVSPKVGPLKVAKLRYVVSNLSQKKSTRFQDSFL